MILLALFVVPFCLALERNAKPGDKVFYSEKGMAVINHVISLHVVTSAIDCSFLCKSHDKCKSYNYKPRGPGDKDVCQLNNATRKTNPGSNKADADFVHYFDQSESFKSCVDYLRKGAKENGIYTITDSGGDSYPVFCDLNSEPRSAWTLVLSFAFKNRNIAAFCTNPILKNSPLNEDHPNWETYRLSLGRMQRLSKQSTHVRFTTSFPEYNVDFKDYLRAKIAHLDIVSISGDGICKIVEVINVRNHTAFDVTAPFWQDEGQFLHTDTEFKRTCQFDASKGSLGTENNFGTYCHHNSVNPAFRGCENDDSTTNHWFGGYM